MKVSEVTNDDGKNCVLLVKFLTNGRWDLSGQDAETLIRVKRWVQEVAGAMATQLQAAHQPVVAAAPTPTPQSSGFRVKSMGSLPTKPQRKKK